MNKSYISAVRTVLLAAVLTISSNAVSQSLDVKNMPWKTVCRITDTDWLDSEEAASVADSVVKYQLDNGGWIKNQDWHRSADHHYFEQCNTSGSGATIDNGATWQEMKFIARIYSHHADRHYRKAFLRGLDYLFEAQYANGGFPQFYPQRDGRPTYSDHITFNDGAMINVLRMMKDIAGDVQPYAALQLSDNIRKRARESYERGVQCVLDCQIRVGDEPTVWCMQHDSRTLLPAKARAYEHPTYCGHGETVEIINFLMDEPNPSAEVVHAVTCAVEWLEAHKIENMRLETFVNADGKKDRRLVRSEGASPLWARFYDLADAEPLFCGRDGIPRKCLADIDHERRNGYQWVGDSPRRVIERFKVWKTDINQ